jgi:hypothetical protein
MSPILEKPVAKGFTRHKDHDQFNFCPSCFGDAQWLCGGYHRKNYSDMGFLEKEMPLLVSVSFFEMPFEVLGSATCSLNRLEQSKEVFMEKGW